MKFLLLATSFVLVSATPEPEEDFLKREFLACDAVASQYMLDDAAGAYCSEIYEKLKNQYFNGNAAALLGWWREVKSQIGPQ